MSPISLDPAGLLEKCISSSIPFPTLFGAQFLSLDATPVRNYSLSSESSRPNIDFCNITVVYTHPGRDDTIEVVIGLPLDNWNGRFQALGGGGWTTGYSGVAQVPAISEGYSTAATDGGHSMYATLDDWAQVSPGNVNLNLLQDFASLALNDLSIIGKQITASFYGTPPKKSYWNGCSTGGR